MLFLKCLPLKKPTWFKWIYDPITVFKRWAFIDANNLYSMTMFYSLDLWRFVTKPALSLKRVKTFSPSGENHVWLCLQLVLFGTVEWKTIQGCTPEKYGWAYSGQEMMSKNWRKAKHQLCIHILSMHEACWPLLLPQGYLNPVSVGSLASQIQSPTLY